MTITQATPDPSTRLQLEGALTIASAAELKETLLQALGAGTDITVALDRVNAIDVTAVQLLYAAQAEAAKAGVALRFTGPLAEAAAAPLRTAGLDVASLFCMGQITPPGAPVARHDA